MHFRTRCERAECDLFEDAGQRLTESAHILTCDPFCLNGCGAVRFTGGVVAGLVLAHAIGGSEAYEFLTRMMAAAVGVIAFLVARDAKTDSFPFLPFAAAKMYLFFGFPVLFEQRLMTLMGPIGLSERSWQAAVWSCLVAIVVIYFSSRVGESFADRTTARALLRLVPRTCGPRFETTVRLFSIASLATGATQLLRPEVFPAAAAFFVQLLVTPALGQVLLFEAYKRSPTLVSKVWFWGYTGGTAMFAFLSGMLGIALLPLVVAGYLVSTTQRSLRIRWIVLVALFFMILNPAKSVYREKVWTSSTGWAASDIGVGTRVGVWYEAVVDTWFNPQSEIDEQVDSSKSRLAAIPYVAQVFEWVPHRVPYAGWHRWAAIPTSYIPRSIWKNKPDMSDLFNDRYAYTFELMNEYDQSTTTLVLPLMVDGYWSAGWLGVLFTAFMAGLLIGFYKGTFRPSYWSVNLLGIAYLTRVDPTTHLAHQWGGLPTDADRVLRGDFSHPSSFVPVHRRAATHREPAASPRRLTKGAALPRVLFMSRRECGSRRWFSRSPCGDRPRAETRASARRGRCPVDVASDRRREGLCTRCGFCCRSGR